MLIHSNISILAGETIFSVEFVEDKDLELEKREKITLPPCQQSVINSIKLPNTDSTENVYLPMAFQMAAAFVLFDPAEPHCQLLQLHQEDLGNLLPRSSSKLEVVDRVKG